MEAGDKVINLAKKLKELAERARIRTKRINARREEKVI